LQILLTFFVFFIIIIIGMNDDHTVFYKTL